MFANFVGDAKARFITNYKKLKMGTMESKPRVEDFNIIRFIAAGGFGAIFLVQQKERRRYYAAKVFRKKEIVHNYKVLNIL